MISRAVLLAGTLAACTQTASPVHAESVTTGQMMLGPCSADPVQDIVGKRATPGLSTHAMRRAGAAKLRQVGADEAVTMDYREDRLNIEVDAKGIITRVRCG